MNIPAFLLAPPLAAAGPRPHQTSDSPGPWGTLTAAIEELDCVQTYCEGETAYCMHWVPFDSYDTQTGQFMNGDEVAGIVSTEIGECWQTALWRHAEGSEVSGG